MDVEYLRKLDSGELMLHNGKPMKGIVHQKAGCTMIRIDEDDVVIKQGDTRQSARFWIRKKLIEESFVLSQEEKEALIWMPSERRERLLEAWWQKRQDLIAYCMSRITASMKDVQRFLGNDF